jgi:hypothetical protein
MFVSLLIAAMIAAPLPQDAQEPEGPPQRIRNVILFGEEKCPPSTDPEEIVVCASAGESPYRIPKQFRNQPSDKPDAQSWARRSELVEEVNSQTLPGSCSPVGMYGQSGCSRAFIRQWAQERLEKRVREGREGAPQQK